MNKFLLEAKHLKKHYIKGNIKVEAVREVNFGIDSGERVYVHGPSGAGKSTLMDLIGGLLKPSSGSVFFRGKRIDNMPGRYVSGVRNREFGFIFQFFNLMNELNVIENVCLPAMIGGKGRKIKDKAMGLLGKVGIEKRAFHFPNELSGGEAQRVAIARSLINSPSVLFCDEPAGSLDSENGKEIYSLIKETSEKNEMSVIIVSHQEVKSDFYHTEYFMKDGVLAECTGQRA